LGQNRIQKFETTRPTKFIEAQNIVKIVKKRKCCKNRKKRKPIDFDKNRVVSVLSIPASSGLFLPPLSTSHAPLLRRQELPTDLVPHCSQLVDLTRSRPIAPNSEDMSSSGSRAPTAPRRPDHSSSGRFSSKHNDNGKGQQRIWLPGSNPF
jgi:hypothetical protein